MAGVLDVVALADILTVVITLLGSLGATIPLVAKFKNKLDHAKNLVIAIDDALADDAVTKKELQTIARYASLIIGVKPDSLTSKLKEAKKD